MKRRIRVTESDLKNIIKESVKRILKEDMDKELMLQKQMKNFYDEELNLYQELENFLKRNGIQNVSLRKNGNSIKLSLPTVDYNKEVESLLNKFASSKQLFVNDNIYPATTYITLTTY